MALHVYTSLVSAQCNYRIACIKIVRLFMHWDMYRGKKLKRMHAAELLGSDDHILNVHVAKWAPVN